MTGTTAGSVHTLGTVRSAEGRGVVRLEHRLEADVDVDAFARAAAAARRERTAQACRRALALTLDWMFDGLDLDRVEMTTTPDNEAVFALAARLGFACEGTLRARNLERGVRVDVVMFGLLRGEWRQNASSVAARRPSYSK